MQRRCATTTRRDSVDSVRLFSIRRSGLQGHRYAVFCSKSHASATSRRERGTTTSSINSAALRWLRSTVSVVQSKKLQAFKSAVCVANSSCSDTTVTSLIPDAAISRAQTTRGISMKCAALWILSVSRGMKSTQYSASFLVSFSWEISHSLRR